MTTNHKTINEIECNSADWPNACITLPTGLVYSVINHPCAALISIPFMFSYHYQASKQIMSVKENRLYSTHKVLDVLDKLMEQ